MIGKRWPVGNPQRQGRPEARRPADVLSTFEERNHHERSSTPLAPSPIFTLIRKRNQREEPFDAGKITAAILKAGRATAEFDQAEARRLTIRFLSLAQVMFEETAPSVEEIQDLVEEVLLASPYQKTAKAYILYRDQHARIREMVAKADLKLIENYLEKLDWQVQENSNMSYSLQGLNNYISSEVSKNLLAQQDLYTGGTPGPSGR